MEDIVEEQPQRTEILESSPVASVPVAIDEITKTEEPATTSLVQSLLQEQSDGTGDKKKKKKKKGKTGRQKELVNSDLVRLKK